MKNNLYKLSMLLLLSFLLNACSSKFGIAKKNKYSTYSNHKNNFNLDQKTATVTTESLHADSINRFIAPAFYSKKEPQLAPKKTCAKRSLAKEKKFRYTSEYKPRIIKNRIFLPSSQAVFVSDQATTSSEISDQKLEIIVCLLLFTANVTGIALLYKNRIG